MSDIEWVHPEPLSGEPVSPFVVDMPEARAITVGPDEALIIVFPQFLGMREIYEHQERIRNVIGNRFVIMSGGDIRLAKVRRDEWAPDAFG